MALDSVVSDMFGKSATAITDYFISENTFNKVDMPEVLKEKQLFKVVKQATEFLEKQGMTVSS